MSKTAEQKALEEYPTPLDNEPFISKGFIDEKRREGCIVGYDQAMQDFLDYLKYCSTFTDINGNTRIDNDLLSVLIEEFKNYIQNESEKQ